MSFTTIGDGNGKETGTPLDHNRSISIAGFHEQSHAIAAAGMRNELNRLVEMVPEGPDRAAFALEMDNFYSLFTRYLAEKAKGTKL